MGNQQMTSRNNRRCRQQQQQQLQYHDTDEQLARDLQLALDLQAKEEQSAAITTATTTANDNNNNNNNINAKYMLFVSCTLDNAHDVKLLVDTGASSSAMSLDMAQNLGLLSKLNRNVYGSAKGVGSSNIVGILENIELIFQHNKNLEFRLCFLVLDSPTLPCCILGLDQMRKYKCQIDLDAKELVFGGKGGVTVPFLPQYQAQQVAQQMLAKSERSTTTSRKEQEQGEIMDPFSSTWEGIVNSFFRF
jgi:hypothetical protein